MNNAFTKIAVGLIDANMIADPHLSIRKIVESININTSMSDEEILRLYYTYRLRGMSQENIDKVPLYKLQQWDNELHGAV